MNIPFNLIHKNIVNRNALLIRSVIVFNWFLWMILSSPSCYGVKTEVINFEDFENVYLYFPDKEIKSVVLFISGDGGWNKGVFDMATTLSEKGALVAGIDYPKYILKYEGKKEECLYPASQFESLSQFIQKKYQFEKYLKPILAGYSSGATFAYALIVQAPFGTFAGAISLGFCPDITIKKPLCKGSGIEATEIANPKGYFLKPNVTLQVTWMVLQGEIDQVCNANETKSFVSKIPTAKIFLLPKVGHGYSVKANWLPSYLEAYNNILTSEIALEKKADPIAVTSSNTDDLPLNLTPVKTSDKPFMAVILSGDGGWTSFDQNIANYFASQGIPSAGLNVLQYFWSYHSPDISSSDLLRIIRRFSSEWKKNQIILIGYSYGADVLPFMINRLPADIKSHIAGVGLISPSDYASFEFHISAWINYKSGDKNLQVKPEIEKMLPIKIICIYGSDETETLVKTLDNKKFTTIELPGGHHFNGDSELLGKTILQYIK